MDQNRRWLLPVVLAALFMYGFDLNVVNVAVPSLQHDLHAGQAALELIVGGYAFTYAAGLMTGGRLGDLLGYRTMFLLGMAGFTVASTLCGLAQTPRQLVGARLLQGLTAAAMVPQILSLITVTFPAGERPRALAWFGVTAAVSGVFGQVLGGILLVTDAFGLGWRSVFFLNLPVGLVVLTFALRLLPRTAIERRPSLDLVGLVGITASLALAQVPLVLGREEGWPLWTWVLLAVSVPAMVLTLGYERRLARRGGNPLLDLSLFASRTFSSGLCVSIAFMAYFTSSIFVFSLLLQNRERPGISQPQCADTDISYGPKRVTYFCTRRHRMRPRIQDRCQEDDSAREVGRGRHRTPGRTALRVPAAAPAGDGRRPDRADRRQPRSGDQGPRPADRPRSRLPATRPTGALQRRHAGPGGGRPDRRP